MEQKPRHWFIAGVVVIFIFIYQAFRNDLATVLGRSAYMIDAVGFAALVIFASALVIILEPRTARAKWHVPMRLRLFSLLFLIGIFGYMFSRDALASYPKWDFDRLDGIAKAILIICTFWLLRYLPPFTDETDQNSEESSSKTDA